MLFPAMFLLQAGVTAKQPAYFAAVLIGSLVVGGIGWLIAAVLGFARARAFGASTRWFSFAAVCLLIYHIQFVLLGFGAFLNVFVVAGAFCAIMGFVRLTNPR